MDPAQEIDAARKTPDEDFIGMHLQPQVVIQKRRDARQQHRKKLPVFRQKSEVVCVTDVMPRLEPMLHELVELVHVDVGEELRGQVPERQADAGPAVGRETLDDVPQERGRLRFRNGFLQNAQQDPVVDAREELADVALQDPTRSGMITTGLPRHRPVTVERAMRPLADSTGEGVGHEAMVEERVQDTVDGMMDQTVADRRLVDDPRLGVADGKPFVRAVPVCPERQLLAQRREVVRQVSLEFLQVGLPALSPRELLPCRKKIL